MHKGSSCINWPIIYGEKPTGLSTFWSDSELDTGPILLQKDRVIHADDTLKSLYFNHLFSMGISVILEAIALVIEGNAPKIPQVAAQGSYEGWCRKEQVQIDWSRRCQEVYGSYPWL